MWRGYAQIKMEDKQIKAEIERQLDDFENWISKEINKELQEYKKKNDGEGANAFVNNIMLKMFSLLVKMEQQGKKIGKSEEAIKKVMMSYREEIKKFIPVLKSEIEKIRQKGVAYIG